MTLNLTIKSPVYREDLVFKILQYTPDDLGNPYKEYADVFKSVWENNKKKPESLRTRILLMDPAYIQDYFDGKDYVYTGSRDDNMFDITGINGKRINNFSRIKHVSR